MGPNHNISGDGETAETAVVMKKGPWTAAEDGILRDYVEKYGEGNWNAVQRNSGLARCGKSCRLRWANHLRPNLKKGAFSQDEERLILELHAKIGNKWARMAAQLPGRTDNEIKNYWNTRVKRRLRQGLPLYPQDIHQQQQSKTPFHQSYLSTPPHQTQNLLPTSPPPPLSLHFTPLSQSGFKRYHSPNIDFSLHPPQQRPSSPLGHYLPSQHSSVGPSMWAPHPYASAFTTFDQQQQQNHCVGAAGRNSIYQGFKPSSLEFPSNQMWMVQHESNHHNNNYDMNMRRSMSVPVKHGSGLLDDLLRESHAHSSVGEIRRHVSLGSEQEIGTFDEFMTHWDDSGPIPSSSEMKTKEEHAEQSNFMHEDLSSIMNQEISNGQSLSNVTDNLHVDVQQFASALPIHNSNWDNMPEICYQ